MFNFYRLFRHKDSTPPDGHVILAGSPRWLFLCGLACVFLLFVVKIVYMWDYTGKTSSMEYTPHWPGSYGNGPNQTKEEEDEVLFQRLPQCIIIGVRKCGTRALLEFLNLHPDVAVAHDEVHFFDKPENYQNGLEWYRQQMANASSSQIVIEKSPAYFITPSVPRRIYHMNSSIRLLLIVRDPVIRSISDYTQILYLRHSKNLTMPPFEKMAFKHSGVLDTEYNAIRTSIYSQFINNWLDVFPRDQLHLVDGDRFIHNPLSELRPIEKFLGLKHWYEEDNFYYNATKRFHCFRNKTVQRCLGSSKGRPHPEVPQRIIKKLKRFYIPYNKLFFNIVGKTFNWSVPSV